MLLVVALMSGCSSDLQPRKEAPDLTVEASWEHVRELVIRPKVCYQSRVAYCVDDQAVLDRHIQFVLDSQHDGIMPLNPRNHNGVAGFARKDLRRWQLGEGKDHVADRIRAYYANPDVTREGTVVKVDVGVLPPGTVTSGDESLLVVSDRVDRGEWSTAEVVRFLDRYREAHPDASAIRLLVQVPDGTEVLREMELRWWISRDEIDVYSEATPNTVWSTGPLSGSLNALRSGERSLHSTSLLRCSAQTYGAPPQRCTEQGG